MELIDGTPPSTVQKRGPLPMPDLLYIAWCIADALTAAHREGLTAGLNRVPRRTPATRAVSSLCCTTCPSFVHTVHHLRSLYPMSATCPTCEAADETVAVHKALQDSDRPLDPPTRELLSMPPEPGGTSGAAITLFILAGLFGLPGLHTLLSGDDGGNSDAAYQVGHRYGTFLVAAILLGIGLAIHSNHRSRRNDTADQWPRTYEQWQQVHRVWRATWLCRRCRVAFLPAASLRPDFAASPTVPVAQFPQWTVVIARQDDRSGGSGLAAAG
ncbi:hypothetical protein [Kitasatospora sp. NPDC050463]|uniref:hypothetical protein n=1 Tax=Kitasatospora sp. NPDC050463 TaxID=3155786 RepID=UPI0033C168C4